MATSLSHHLLYIHSYSRHYNHLQASSSSSVHPISFFNFVSFKRNPKFCSRSRPLAKSKTPKSSTPSPLSSSSSSSSSSSDFHLPPLLRFRDALNLDELGRDMLSIALPALLALAADPITSLVDTAFVGHLGSVELAAVGVSVSVFNLVSKLFNVPLLNVTTSFVAEEQALASMQNENFIQAGQGYGEKKKALPSVSSSLVLAAGLGLAEAVALTAGSGYLMNIMGISVDSPMRQPAEEFLAMRAFGAPPIVIALAAQGTFRGFKDTKTPLYAIGNLLNATLDLILIYFFGFGISGAAIATVTSEYLIASILLWKLNEEVSLTSPNIDGRRFLQYLKSGGLLIGRTLSVLVPMTLATSMAAREGPVPMAGYEICVQIWLTISLLTDALALAGQALLAGGYSQGNYVQARQVVYRVLQIGFVIGMGLAVILFLGYGGLLNLFTSDAEVLKVAWSGILFVAGSQPMNAVAFVFDGLYYGVSDFEYAAYSTVVAALISSLFLLITAPAFGLPGIWMGLFLFMTFRVIAGSWRLGTKSGPWMKVWSETD
ncbi:protein DETOXIFICATION 44, chloroplastic isoform X2 [Amaranthus tricolor]|uniref:protein DETOXIFICATION 44, chloroplastic isoform X2 n=1 Tax=Amaranthus tricolor TaxID=29722 RepID=UPI002590966B|nr:protein DETOXIFICATION 44, chloroplastic isoform X2 [Amaranthus tricolor]